MPPLISPRGLGTLKRALMDSEPSLDPPNATQARRDPDGPRTTLAASPYTGSSALSRLSPRLVTSKTPSRDGPDLTPS